MHTGNGVANGVCRIQWLTRDGYDWNSSKHGPAIQSQRTSFSLMECPLKEDMADHEGMQSSQSVLNGRTDPSSTALDRLPV